MSNDLIPRCLVSSATSSRILLALFCVAAPASVLADAKTDAAMLDSPTARWSRDVPLRDLASEVEPVPNMIEALPPASGRLGKTASAAACATSVLLGSAVGSQVDSSVCPVNRMPESPRVNSPAPARR